MGLHYADTVDKHGIPREDSVHAILHAEVSAEIVGEPNDVTTVYIGHPHAQTDRYIEVITAQKPSGALVIFHSMPLSDSFRYLLSEGE